MGAGCAVTYGSSQLLVHCCLLTTACVDSTVPVQEYMMPLPILPWQSIGELPYLIPFPILDPIHNASFQEYYLVLFLTANVWAMRRGAL